MKLSTALIGTLLLAGSRANAQTPKTVKPPEKVMQNQVIRINEAGEPLKFEEKEIENKRLLIKSDTLKADSTKINHKVIGPDYCPPCGMG